VIHIHARINHGDDDALALGGLILREVPETIHIASALAFRIPRGCLS
jgi:hypothetical protein